MFSPRGTKSESFTLKQWQSPWPKSPQSFNTRSSLCLRENPTTGSSTTCGTSSTVTPPTLQLNWVELITGTLGSSCETPYTQQYCLRLTTHPLKQEEHLQSPQKILRKYDCTYEMNMHKPVTYTNTITIWTHI